jgi:nucleotide-binding universal stress UspA family protein
MFQSCLICTDFSDGLDRLVNFVSALGDGGFKKIIFFHSVPLWQKGEIPRIDEEKVEKAKKRFAIALRAAPEAIATNNPSEGVEVIIEVASGKPLDTIPRFLKNNPVDVIFIGTPIRSLLQEKVFGSTTMGLAKLTSTPLAILRPQLLSTYTKEELTLRCKNLWRSLSIPYNDSKAAKYLIDRLKNYLGNPQQHNPQRCSLIWIIEESRQKFLTDARLQEAETKLNSVKSELEALGCQVNVTIQIGSPLPILLETTANLDISAIAIAADSQQNFFQRAAPSFAEELLRRSWFPLLFFSCPP